MTTTAIKSFQIVGISVRTTNQNNMAMKDIPGLWETFMNEAIMEKIPNKLSDEIYCVYTDYEDDHNKPYTTLIGCKVDGSKEIPNDMDSATIQSGDYALSQAKGNLQEGAVIKTWHNIWSSDISRAYTTDFEVYGAKAIDPSNAEVDIFVATK